MVFKKIRQYGVFAPLKSYFGTCRSLDISLIRAVIELPGYIKQELVGSVFTGFHLYDCPLLISYSRSGTNWVLYLIEQLTQKPTFRPERSIPGYDYAVDRAHQGYLVANKYKKLILLIRDYRECLLREREIRWKKLKNVEAFLEDSTGRQPAKDYMENLRAFDEHLGPKLLIYYEDLLQNPDKEIMRLAEFLEAPLDNLSNLLENLELHKRRSIAAYSRGHRSETQGLTTHLFYHADRFLSDVEKRKFDEILESWDRAIFARYISRYRMPLRH